MTLIEVLAATVLLSLVLVGVVLARGRAIGQWAQANRVLAASDAADAWLTDHWTDPDGFPRDGQGVLDDDMNLHWRTQTVSNPAVEVLSGVCVRLEVYEAGADWEDESLLAIELVVPGEPQTQEPATGLVGGSP